MYTYVYTYIYTYVYIRIYTYIYASFVPPCIYVHIRTYILYPSTGYLLEGRGEEGGGTCLARSGRKWLETCRCIFSRKHLMYFLAACRQSQCCDTKLASHIPIHSKLNQKQPPLVPVATHSCVRMYVHIYVYTYVRIRMHSYCKSYTPCDMLLAVSQIVP